MIIIINVYDSKETSFTANGLVVLSDTISCLITEELNGRYELTLEYPLDQRRKWTYLIEGNIIKANGQLFRIYHKVKTLYSIKVNARHIFYDLLDNFLEDVRPTDMSGYGALDYILTNTQFPHSFTSVGDVGGSNTRYFVRTNPVAAIMGNDGIISIWGGELKRDNFNVGIYSAIGQDRGVLIAYGKNIQGIEETLDMDNVCTRLMPVGKDGLLLPEKYIDSPYIDNYPHPKVKSQDFSNCADETSLRSAGQAFMTDNKIDIPKFNYKIDFLELTKTEEYKNYAILETVYLGDIVTVKHSKLNIDLKAKVISIIKDCITGRITKVELGSFKPNLATSFNNAIQAVKKSVTETKTSLQNSIDNATQQINSALGGYVVKRNGELLIMDTEDVETAEKVWRWNQNGLGYSETGYNGPYRTAITADGHIVADFIDTGKLTANIIQGGILKLGGVDDTNGILQLVNSEGSVIGYMNKDGVFITTGTFAVGDTDADETRVWGQGITLSHKNTEDPSKDSAISIYTQEGYVIFNTNGCEIRVNNVLKVLNRLEANSLLIYGDTSIGGKVGFNNYAPKGIQTVQIPVSTDSLDTAISKIQTLYQAMNGIGLITW